MSDYPLVSIIIPVYNGANYVGEAIESALAQTHPNTEVIVVDDGSSDQGATRAVAEQFGERIRYVWKPNGGVATALNTGIAAMRGKLFSWLSHDDLYRPEKVAHQVETWRSFGRDCVVIGDFELIDPERNLLEVQTVAGWNLVARPLDAVFQGLINGCALLIPRSLFDRAGGFEPGLPTTQDYHLWYRLARLVPFVYCPHAGLRQRVHPLQGSRQTSHLDEASRMFSYLIDSTPPELMRAYDGSEARFLMRARQKLTPYAGLLAYLDYRITELLRSFRYGVVIFSESRQALAAAEDHWDRSRYPPMEIVAANLRDSSLAEAARRIASADVLLFVSADHAFPESRFFAGLEQLVHVDAEIARPGQAPAGMPPMHGVVARQDAIPRMRDFLGGGVADWAALHRSVHVTEYSFADQSASSEAHDTVAPANSGPGADQLLPDALAGRQRIFFESGSESAIAEALDGLLNPELPNLLFLTGSPGGEARKHLDALTSALIGKANGIIAHGQPDGYLHLSLHQDGGVAFGIPDQLPALAGILNRVGVDRVDFHHTVDFEGEAERLIDALGVAFDLTLVDYRAETYGATPSALLRRAARIFAPCRDLASVMQARCPDLPVIPALHWHESLSTRVRHVFVPRLWGNEPLRVLIIGPIEEQSLCALILEAAFLAARRNLPLRFHVLGEMDMSGLDEHLRDVLTVHGRIEPGQFSAKLGGIAPHLGWLPAQAPDAWDYTLSELMIAALPVAATAAGSIPERCQNRPGTWLLPPRTTALSWVNLFLKLHATGLRYPPQYVSTDHLPPAEKIYFEHYLREAIQNRCARFVRS